MYANAPPEVEALKAMFLLSASWVAVGGSGGTNIHYPSTSAGDSASADAPPYIVIEPSKNNPKVLAPGVVVPGGTLQALLVMKDANGLDIEKTGRAILDEIAVLPTGLPIIGTDVGMCSEPAGGARASQEYADENTLTQSNALRTLPLIITYGLT